MTLATLWQTHANRHLPNDASAATVTRARRAWYGEHMDRLLLAEKTPQNEALLAEAVGFGRTIGREIEHLT